MTRRLYPDVYRCRALVIDGNPTSRSLLTAMLRGMGLCHIVQTSRVLDARRSLENRVFDIVLCDYHFDNSPMSGQDLLDDLRRTQLLPYSTVFVMVTGEASYARVAEVAESALDCYLLKPHSATALEQRLLQARHRKKILRHIFDAIEAGELERASQQCQAHFEKRQAYWLYAARIGAELNIRLGRHEAARELYAAVQATQALPWARLGIARVEVETGQLNRANATLQSLIGDEPSYADAYDVMGRCQVEQGELEAALATFRMATSLTPTSITRLQKQGMLAFLAGQTQESQSTLERAVRIGLTSKMFDCQSLVMLAQLHFDQGDKKAFGRNHDNLLKAAERDPQSVRLRRFTALSTALKLLLERQIADCVNQVKQLAQEVAAEDFDFEAATNLCSLLSRLQRTELQLPDAQDWVRAVARRFCVSHAATDLLCLTVKDVEPYADVVRASYADISRMAEQAMTHSVSGSPLATVKALVVNGGQTRNAKLIELAALVLQRHAEKIGDIAPMAALIGDLKQKYCSAGTRVAVGGSSGRAPGGLSLPAAARA